MIERYIVTSAAGEHVIRTDSATEAASRAEQLRGTVIDTEALS